MSSYSRVPGGEKNKKTGVRWDRQELVEVYYLFKKLNGVGLHERNPEIQKLAAKLKRTVRSTEAQALMYRNLDRGGNYSHGNMNKICVEIWSEMEKSEENIIMKPYPEGLLDWAGHKKGGVKKPFDLTSGRPNGFVIETKLTLKLEEWARNLDKGDGPKIILLVGGPGNGKTDALEYLVTKIDEYHNTTFFDAISKQIDDDKSVPRTLSVSNSSSKLSFDKINIVQDASTGDSNQSSELCLVKDLEKAQKSNDIYLACINRGILAQALTVAHEVDSSSYIVFNSITKALTQNLDQLSLWPLQVDEAIPSNIGVWPMDIESLVSLNENGYSPALKIFQEAVKEDHWKCGDCQINKDLCPFFQNKKELQVEKSLTGLIKLLRDYEIISNKRWSFRELFSLTAYILVGSEQDFGKMSPCEWSQDQISKLGSNDVKTEITSLWSLNEHLYHTRLFNKWPSFNSISRSRSGDYHSILAASDELKSFFSYFSYVRPKQAYRPDISKIIDNQFFNTMDPGQISNVELDIENGALTLNEIESLFSYSVNTGQKKIEKYLNPLEDSLFSLLARLESTVDNDIRMNTSNSNSKIDEVIAILRSTGSRYFKRIYFSKIGYSKDYKYLNEFSGLSADKDLDLSKLKNAKRLFDQLIHDKTKLDLSLNTSFAQPEPDILNKISLIVNGVQIKTKYTEIKYMDVPRSQSAILTIKTKTSYHIPLTYQLHKALMMIDNRIRTSSLPEEVIAMLDNIKSRLGGIIVRDDDHLFNSTIKIGNSKNTYRISSAQNELEIEIDRE
jgi:hypothetical protein